MVTLPTDDRVGRRPALLLQGHGRRQAVDLVDLGHAQLVEQPPGVGGDRFEVPPLRLGVERAEGQRRLARARTRPVKTTRASRGMSRSTFLRLCSRAPRTRTNPANARSGVTPRGKDLDLIHFTHRQPYLLAWATALPPCGLPRRLQGVEEQTSRSLLRLDVDPHPGPDLSPDLDVIDARDRDVTASWASGTLRVIGPLVGLVVLDVHHVLEVERGLPAVLQVDDLAGW